MADKYESLKWKRNPQARDFVSLLHKYIDDISIQMQVNDIIYKDSKLGRHYSNNIIIWIFYILRWLLNSLTLVQESRNPVDFALENHL